ncbi:MAG: PstS family phosphate ABC transporter substrate-binding protein [Bacteroidota bacterium]
MNKSFFYLALLLATSCGTDFKKPYSDTPTSGIVKITSDETFQPLIDSEKDTFMGLYKYAQVNISHKSEADCFKDLINDSAKTIVVSRQLNEKEKFYFHSRNLIPITTKIALDAIAIVVNKDNPDSLLNTKQLTSILSGEYSNWNQVYSNSKLGKISVVFDNNGSSNVRYLKDNLLKGSALSSNCFASQSNPGVIKFVEENKNAIGIIGVSWISDFDDKTTQGFLSRVKVLDLTTSDHPVYPDDYYKPYQAYIALSQYPLIREVYMINREGRAGLGTGFVSFVAGDAGQRIIRMAGLLPATMPVRLIKTE